MLWSRRDSSITRDDFFALVRFLMKMDAKLNYILEELGIDDGED